MSTQTTKLNLIKPELTDNGRQTIQDLANNFQKIDDAASIYMSDLPTSGVWEKDKIIYLNNRSIGDFIGAVNLRKGMAAKGWGSINQYHVGDEVSPSTNNGHYYKCIQSGHSSPFEPDWSVASESITEDTRNKSIWQPSKLYNVYDIVVPTIDNDRFYVCITAGTSGTDEPEWPSLIGASVSDNQAIWMSYKVVKWQEAGISANFRPFGKIE